MRSRVRLRPSPPFVPEFVLSGERAVGDALLVFLR